MALVKEKLLAIREVYAPRRLEALGIDVSKAADAWVLKSNNIFRAFKANCLSMFKNCRTADASILNDFGNHVFEGAQGLLLDQDYGVMPHVTRSNTGLRNVVDLAKRANISDLQVVYATRLYLTRHGAGPVPNEIDYMPYRNIVDETNKPGPYQGSLRFAFLDTTLTANAIRHDVETYREDRVASYHVAVTCCDQAETSMLVYYENGECHNGDTDELVNSLIRQARADGVHFQSWGPTRTTVKKIQ